jgi:dishevelled associated activator of morphogenesis
LRTNNLFFFNKIIRLATEEELRAARDKADDMEKENTEMATKLAKKEQELDQLCQEKVRKQLFTSLSNIFKFNI